MNSKSFFVVLVAVSALSLVLCGCDGKCCCRHDSKGENGGTSATVYQQPPSPQPVYYQPAPLAPPAPQARYVEPMRRVHLPPVCYRPVPNYRPVPMCPPRYMVVRPPNLYWGFNFGHESRRRMPCPPSRPGGPPPYAR